MEGLLSYMTEEIFFFERQIPEVKPEIPAPTIETCGDKLFMQFSSAQACFAFAHEAYLLPEEA